MTKIPSTRLRFCLKTKHPTVGQTDGKLSVVKTDMCGQGQNPLSYITPLMGGKWHEVLSKGGFSLLRNFYVGTHVNFIITRDFPYIASILFTRVKFTCVRT